MSTRVTCLHGNVHSPAETGHTDAYKLMTGLVIPRPIGWIGTIDDQDRPNLAPYSFFQCVATNPPVVLFSAGISDGHEKDSLVNTRATGEFTCNLVDMATVEAMNQSAAELDRGESEFDFAGLTTACVGIDRGSSGAGSQGKFRMSRPTDRGTR